MRRSIVLIGPSGVGKTTVGRLLGDQLGMTFLDLDDLRDRYYEDFGQSPGAVVRRLARIINVQRP